MSSRFNRVCLLLLFSTSLDYSESLELFIGFSITFFPITSITLFVAIGAAFYFWCSSRKGQSVAPEVSQCLGLSCVD